MKKFIAYCGLDCEKCDARTATLNNDNALREKTATAWSQLNGIPITPEMINCEGCRVDGVKTPFCNSLCPIRQCALGKRYETCGDCEAMNGCRTVGMVTSNNTEALNNLKDKGKANKMNHDYCIRLERKEEEREVENLVREAFWNVYRSGCLEHYVLHCLRNDPAFVPELDFVMEKNGELIGQVIYMKAFIDADDGRKIPIMTMGPISILPQYKMQGYGKVLLDYSMEKAKGMGVGALCFEGNIDFYGKSGFVVASSKGIHYHGEPRENEVPYFLLKELKEGYLDGVTGVYHTPKGYYVDEKEAEKFDATFPPKQK